jgi:hypothetical protein
MWENYIRDCDGFLLNCTVTDPRSLATLQVSVSVCLCLCLTTCRTCYPGYCMQKISLSCPSLLLSTCVISTSRYGSCPTSSVCHSTIMCRCLSLFLHLSVSSYLSLYLSLCFCHCIYPSYPRQWLS